MDRSLSHPVLSILLFGEQWERFAAVKLQTPNDSEFLRQQTKVAVSELLRRGPRTRVRRLWLLHLSPDQVHASPSREPLLSSSRRTLQFSTNFAKQVLLTFAKLAWPTLFRKAVQLRSKSQFVRTSRRSSNKPLSTNQRTLR